MTLGNKLLTTPCRDLATDTTGQETGNIADLISDRLGRQVKRRTSPGLGIA